MAYTENDIEKYLLNQLSDIKKAAFEKELASSESLQKEVQQHKLALEAIDLLINDEIANLYPDEVVTSNQVDESSSSIKVKKLGIWKYAAAILLLVGFLSTMYIVNQNSTDKILTQSISIDHLVNPSVAGSSNNTSFEKGINALFNENNLESAIQNFRLSPTTKNKFYEGFCEMKLKNFNKSMTIFEHLLVNEDTFPRSIASLDQVKWYLLLSKIGNGTYKNKKEIIEQVNQYISSTPETSFWHKEAQKMKQKLSGPF